VIPISVVGEAVAMPRFRLAACWGSGCSVLSDSCFAVQLLLLRLSSHESVSMDQADIFSKDKPIIQQSKIRGNPVYKMPAAGLVVDVGMC